MICFFFPQPNVVGLLDSAHECNRPSLLDFLFSDPPLPRQLLLLLLLLCERSSTRSCAILSSRSVTELSKRSCLSQNSTGSLVIWAKFHLRLSIRTSTAPYPRNQLSFLDHNVHLLRNRTGDQNTSWF